MPKAKVYDKDLVRVKHSDVINYITDKSIIKDGMIVKLESGNYVKVGNRLVKINLEHHIKFDSLTQEEIKCVYKANGKAISEVVYA